MGGASDVSRWHVAKPARSLHRHGRAWHDHPRLCLPPTRHRKETRGWSDQVRPWRDGGM